MAELLALSWAQVVMRAERVATQLHLCGLGYLDRIYGVPAGGCVPAVLVRAALATRGRALTLVDEPDERTLVVDDLIDSGMTAATFPARRFVALYRKAWSPAACGLIDPECIGTAWVQFPWERRDDADPERGALRLLQLVGRDTAADAADLAGRLVELAKTL